MTLDEARTNIGATVIYIPSFGRVEFGVITSVRQHFVFVRYGSATHGIATYPQNIKICV